MFVRKFNEINDGQTLFILFDKEDFEQTDAWKKDLADVFNTAQLETTEGTKSKLTICFHTKLEDVDLSSEKKEGEMLALNFILEQQCSSHEHISGGAVDEFLKSFNNLKGNVENYILNGAMVVNVCRLDRCESEHPELDNYTKFLLAKHTSIVHYIKTGKIPDDVKIFQMIVDST